MNISKEQKRILIPLLIVLIVAGLALLGVFAVPRLVAMANSNHVEPAMKVSISGSLPDELNRNVLKYRMTDGIKTDSGYIKPLTGTPPTIVKYDASAKLIWKQTYPASSDNVTIKNLAPLPSGGFVFTVNPSADETGAVSGSPVVYVCDGSGTIGWSKDYAQEGSRSLDHLFATSQGEILTAGNSNKGAYLSKLNASGKKTAEKTLNGGSDMLTNAAYDDETGLSLLLRSQSKDGGVLNTVELFKSNLESVWKLKLPFAVSGSSFCITSDAIYTVSGDNMFTKLGTDGKIDFQMKMGDDAMVLPDIQTDDTIVASTEKNLFVFDTAGNYIRTLTFDGGTVDKFIKADDSLIAISDKDDQLWYTAYNDDGNLTGKAVCSE